MDSGGVKRDEKGRLLPGSVLNPVGAKPGYKQFKTVFMEKLMEEVKIKMASGGYSNVQAIEAMAQAMINKAINGDVYAFSVISDRVDGRPAQDTNIKGQIAVTYKIVNFKDKQDEDKK